MRAQKPVSLSFTAQAKGTDGSLVPFSLQIHVPDFDDERGYFCIVDCPYIRDEPFRIFGVDEEQACKLSVVFVNRMVEGIVDVFLDDEGLETVIPQVPYVAEHIVKETMDRFGLPLEEE